MTESGESHTLQPQVSNSTKNMCTMKVHHHGKALAMDEKNSVKYVNTSRSARSEEAMNIEKGHKISECQSDHDFPNKTPNLKATCESTYGTSVSSSAGTGTQLNKKISIPTPKEGNGNSILHILK